MTTLSPDFVAEFVYLLRWIHNRYENTQDPETQREVWIDLVRILHRMVREIDPAVDREGLLAPVNDLVESLFSLDFGVADPPLQPRKLTHRPPHPQGALFRGYVAAASELLIRNGATATDADSWVAKRLSREGYQKPSKSTDPRITAATLKGWRKEARERRPGDLMRAAFDTALDSDSGFEQCLTQVSDAYPAILFDGIEERPANVDRTGMLQSLTVIEMICAHFPPPESPEK